MPPLYVVEQGAVVQKEGERIVVRKEGQTLLSVPAFKVEMVVVFGAVQLTTQAMGFLLSNGIEASFLTLDGRLKGRLVPVESRNILLRVRQFERARDEGFRLLVASAVVAAKLTNARVALLRYARNHPEADFAEPVDKLRELIDRVREAKTLDLVRGLEGRGAAVYFQAFARMVRAEFAFEGRNRRPPTDPVNGMLSLGYTLLTHELMSLVAAHGFDPYLGFYHDVRYGRPGLALDLVEEFRQPVADTLVLWLSNKRVMGPDDFTRREEDGAAILKPPALKRFLAAYEQRLQRSVPARGGEGSCTWRELFREQVQAMVRSVNLGIPYRPFTIEG
jgi:CRISPR-associated protein Cas1